ncbi:ATP-dependent DNA helicase [Infirmifilum sp. SLHALR2]|nr:MAG: hypothetical protein B7L53_08260 [Thermofilum sp. NZ13]
MEEVVARIKEVFPYDHPRSGQLELARLVYESVSASKVLIARYPVGFGKTAAVLAGALASGVPRIAYLAHTKSQFQAPIREALRLTDKGVDITAVTLVSRKDLCLFPGKLVADMDYNRFMKFCSLKRASGECPYGEGASNLELPQVLTPPLMRRMGRESGICPYEIALRALEKARLIVASYSYFFNPALFNLIVERGRVNLSETLLVIDEAHNLPTFISDSLSSRLNGSVLASAIGEVQRFGGDEVAETREALKSLMALLDRTATDEGAEIPAEKFLEIAPASASLSRLALSIERRIGVLSATWQVAEFIKSVENLPSDSVLLALNDSEGKAFKVYFYNVPRIARRVFHSVRASVLLSATLPPAEYYAALLGVEKERVVEATYPFTWGENVTLVIVPGLSSRYVLRTAELYRRYAQAIEAVFEDPDARHVLVVFPSYSFMIEVLPYLKARPRLMERHDTTLDEMVEFLIENEKCLLMIVAWGKFSEGVEFRLMKQSLVDTIVIAGLPVPTPSPVNQRLVRVLEASTGNREWAWKQVFLYPGLMKVIQIIGRGVRSEHDRVRVFLLDERAAEPEARSFFELYGINPLVLTRHGRR